MEITFEDKTGHRSINIMNNEHGYIEDQESGLCVLREWHNKERPELYNALMTPDLEAKLLLIQDEFKQLFKRTEQLLTAY